MKLAHVLLETPIDFKEERFVSWVFEDPQIYWSFVKELIGQTQGELGNFVLSNEMKTLKLETDAQVIVDRMKAEKMIQQHLFTTNKQ